MENKRVGKRVSRLGGQKKGPVEDGSMWIHPKMTAGSLATARTLGKGVEKPREIRASIRAVRWSRAPLRSRPEPSEPSGPQAGRRNGNEQEEPENRSATATMGTAMATTGGDAQRRDDASRARRTGDGAVAERRANVASLNPPKIRFPSHRP